MARTNKPKVIESVYTHGDAKASNINLFQQLERSVMSCLLFEDEFYEDGVEISTRIKTLAGQIKPEQVGELAIKARGEGNLRHVPLWLAVALLGNKYSGTSEIIAEIIQRPDEMAELVAMYWAGKKKPLAAQLKKGLAKAFTKFDAYQIAKYRGLDNAITLRDVMFLVHPTPTDKAMAKVYKQLADNTLAAPKTWEKRASAGEDQKKVFTDMIKNNKLGALAMLRNLRNMKDAGVSADIIRQGLKQMNTERVLPYRFITASKYAPEFEPELEEAMFKCLFDMPKLQGKSVLVLDVSGSMGSQLSGKSDMTRVDAAIGLAILARELCTDVRIYATAGNDVTCIAKTEILPNRRGFALRDAFNTSMRKLGGGGIFLTQAMDYVYDKEKTAERIIVLTDEQDTSGREYNPQKANAFGKQNYLINVASAKNGVAYNKFVHINGFSESSIRWMHDYEQLSQ